MRNKIKVSIAQGLDVPNIFKDVSNFVNDVPKAPKFVLRWGMTSNHYLRILKG